MRDLSIRRTSGGLSCLRRVVVPKEISELTHITQEMVNRESVEDSSIIEEMDRLYEKYGENAIFASYNLYFDASFFLGFCNAHGLSYDFDWLDILTLARDRYEYPHKLSNILEGYSTRKWGVGVTRERKEQVQRVKNSHRAIDDVEAAYLILSYMLEDFDDIGKYIGLVGHPKAHPFKKNKHIMSIINNGKGRERGKIVTKVQFYKREYPLYFREEHDLEIYKMQHRYTDEEIIDEFGDIDFKLTLGIEYLKKH